MWDCESVEPRLTPYVDGALRADERAAVDRHLAACGRCREAAEAERAAVLAIARAGPALRGVRAPAPLQAWCAGIAARPAAPDARRVRVWLVQAAAAATLVLVAGAYLLHVATLRSTTLLAAQLTADHVKCFFTAHERSAEPGAVAARLQRDYGFEARVPPGRADLGLRLVGARRCLSGDGTNAHILYTWQGEQLSLYMLPDEERPAESRHLLGHDTSVWTGHNGTYVLVTPDVTADRLAPVAEYFRRATE